MEICIFSYYSIPYQKTFVKNLKYFYGFLSFSNKKALLETNKALFERIICGDESYPCEYNKKRSALPSKAQKRHGKDRGERLRSKLSLP